MIMQYVPITGFPNGAQPYSNITPFTYRDGATYNEVLESLRVWLKDTLVPWMNDAADDLDTAWKNEVTLLLDAVNTALSAQVDQVNDAIDGVVNNSVTIQDPVVKTLVQDALSETGAALRTIFASNAGLNAVDADVTALETLTATGRLSQASLDNDYADKTNTTQALSAINTDIGTLETDVSSIDIRLDGLEGESASFNKRSAEVALAVKRGGFYDVDIFQNLRDGIANPALTTRVVVLGDSHAVGGHSRHIEQSMYNRLSARARGTMTDLAGVPGAVSGAGMKWYNGAINGSTSGSYYPTGVKTKLDFVKPNYVIHNIGVNDFSQQIDLVTFKNNIRNAYIDIEAANPLAVNVQIHSHGLPKPPGTINIPWSSYAAAMQEVVAELPSRRVFVDLNDPFTLKGMDTTDSAGLLNVDKVHLNEHGCLFYADILGAQMGIPSETEHARIRVFDFPNPITTVISSTVTITSLTIPAANYPRYVQVVGNLYAPTNGNEANMVTVVKMSTGEEWRQIFGNGNQAKIALSAVHFIPQGAPETIYLNVIIVGGTVQFDGSDSFNGIRAIVSPA